MGTDSLYYIMDYSGNYYRTNRADQLVATTGEQDATVFTFTQANRHIGAGKKALFYCMVPIEGTDGMNGEETGSREIEYVSPIKELTYDEAPEPVEKNVASYDLYEMDWAEYLTHFAYLVEGLKCYREELADLVELLRVCRENRRDIKDELQKIEYFQNNLGTNANAAKAKQALKCIKGLETRQYKPRKYEELFENCMLKDRRLQKEDICGTGCDHETDKHGFRINPVVKDEGGEETMIEEREFTPYDGKENDWLAFAKRQAEFYRNAEQYITNLRMDIKEIDQEIETILLETEDANCNVAQGYKVFKKLKELRLEKKAKNRELKSLYALTDGINCKALAETCGDNLKKVETIMEVPGNSEVIKMQPVDDMQEEIHIVEEVKDMVG